MMELNSDADHLARMKAKEDERQKLLAEREREAEPVAAALREAGIDVSSIWELSGDGLSFPHAVPVLLEQLKRDYPDHVRESILRALATPDARHYWDELVALFEHNTAKLPPSIRYLAALALGASADEKVLDDVIRLVNRKELGFDRAPLLLALVGSKSPKAKMTLLELRADPDLGKEIKKMRRLGRMN